MVVTLAGARKQEEEERSCLQKEKDSQMRPTTVETELAMLEMQRGSAQRSHQKVASWMTTCSVVADRG